LPSHLTHFEKTGKFKPAIREWKALPTTSKTVAKFPVYIQKEFRERRKHDKSTAGSVGRGIANSVIDKQVDEMDRLKAQAMLLAEFANTMAEQSQKQFKEMMEEFTKTLKSKDSPDILFTVGGTLDHLDVTQLMTIYSKNGMALKLPPRTLRKETGSNVSY
jgi:hypothetical protein